MTFLTGMETYENREEVLIGDKVHDLPNRDGNKELQSMNGRLYVRS